MPRLLEDGTRLLKNRQNILDAIESLGRLLKPRQRGTVRTQEGGELAKAGDFGEWPSWRALGHRPVSFRTHKHLYQPYRRLPPATSTTPQEGAAEGVLTCAAGARRTGRKARLADDPDGPACQVTGSSPFSHGRSARVTPESDSSQFGSTELARAGPSWCAHRRGRRQARHWFRGESQPACRPFSPTAVSTFVPERVSVRCNACIPGNVESQQGR
jgi:hypothetical protein